MGKKCKRFFFTENSVLIKKKNNKKDIEFADRNPASIC